MFTAVAVTPSVFCASWDSGPPLFGRSDFRRHHGPGGPVHGPGAAPHPPTVRQARPSPPDQVRRVRRAYCPICGTGPRGTLVDPLRRSRSSSLPTSSCTCSAWHGAWPRGLIRFRPARRGPPQGSHHVLVGDGRQRDSDAHPGDESVLARPSAPAGSRSAPTATCSLMPATRACAPSFRRRARRRPLHPSSGPCAGRPLRAYPTTSSPSEPAARARRAIEFMTAFHPLVRDDSSTVRELWCVLAFVMAAGSLLAEGTTGW